MILTNELTIVTPILGCKVINGKPRALLRNPVSGKPGLVDKVWQAHFAAAAADLGIEYTSSMVTLPDAYEASQYKEYLRTFSAFKKERFESIPKGAVISFDVILMEQQLAPADYAQILSVAAEYYGLSQWGNKFGFGRADVKSVKKKALRASLDFDNLNI